MDSDITQFIDAWKDDERGIKAFFSGVLTVLCAIPGGSLSLVSRPGVSHSLRAELPQRGERPLFTLMDVIEDADGRWLSVCFYGDSITDPDELGNLVPGGLLSEDGYCFDVEERDEELLAYLSERIREAARAS